jgi:hypothetical protein
MKRVKIIKYSSDICWWTDCIGQESDVLEVYEPTGYIRIKVTKTDPNVLIDPTYELEGYIPSDCIEVIE